MPEANKATLKRQLTAEVMEALIQRPDLRVVKVADSASDNWSYLSEFPVGQEVLDFYHALSISVPRWEPPMGRARQVPGTLRDVECGAARCAEGSTPS